MLGQRIMQFVWRCASCSAVYDGESVSFLYIDDEHGYCPCGGRLEEGVASEDERHYRLVIPEDLRGTSLHRQIENLLADDEGIEITRGRRGDRHIGLFSCTSRG